MTFSPAAVDPETGTAGVAVQIGNRSPAVIADALARGRAAAVGAGEARMADAIRHGHRHYDRL